MGSALKNPKISEKSEKKVLQSVAEWCKIPFAVTLGAMTRKVAAQPVISAEQCLAQEADDEVTVQKECGSALFLL